MKERTDETSSWSKEYTEPNELTTNLSYTSMAFSVAVATGYSCKSSKELWGKVSSKVEGTISGASPYGEEGQYEYIILMLL